MTFFNRMAVLAGRKVKKEGVGLLPRSLQEISGGVLRPRTQPAVSDPHLRLKVADTSLKSSRCWDAREGWRWLCRDKNHTGKKKKNHTGQRPGGGGDCRGRGPENLRTCQSSFVIGKANRKRSIMENSGQTGCVSEI